MEITEIIRQWQSHRGVHQMARSTGLSRNTIRRYILAARSAGLVRDGPPPTESQLLSLVQLNKAGPRQVVAPTDQVLELWAEKIEQWLKQDKLKLTRVQDLLAQHHCLVAYTCLRRYVMRRGWFGNPQATVRMADTAPGEMAEVDFGYLGLVWDPETGRKRKAWEMLTVLGYSRHSFLWPLFGQQLADVIEGLEATWAFLGGVPRYLVLDNFPAAVAGVDPLNPQLTVASWSMPSTGDLSPTRPGPVIQR